MMWHIEAKQAENISKSIGDFCHDRCYSSATYRLVDRLDKAVAPSETQRFCIFSIAEPGTGSDGHRSPENTASSVEGHGDESRPLRRPAAP